MNEIIIRENAELGNSQLGKLTLKIIKLNNGEIKSEKERAVAIHKVYTERLFEKAGFATVADWSEKFIGMSKSTVSRICRAVNRFFNASDVWEAFTLSQMFEMYKLEDAKLAALNITPDLTVAEIRRRIKEDSEIIDVQSDPAEDSAETTDPAEDIAETADTEPEDNGRLVNDVTVLLQVVKQAAIHGDTIHIEKVLTPTEAWRIVIE